MEHLVELGSCLLCCLSFGWKASRAVLCQCRHVKMEKTCKAFSNFLQCFGKFVNLINHKIKNILKLFLNLGLQANPGKFTFLFIKKIKIISFQKTNQYSIRLFCLTRLHGVNYLSIFVETRLVKYLSPSFFLSFSCLYWRRDEERLMRATPTSSQKHAGKKNEHDARTNIIKALELKLSDGGNSSTLI